jgi:regulator of sigma E protease
MNFLQLLLIHTETFLFSVVGFILMMSFVVFIHEYGHFAVARLCGVKVMDFSIGFGKKIFSRQDKHGTNWSISLIPMGGYVRFFGDKSLASDEDIDALATMSDSDKKQSFYFKSIPQKMAIILAGPLANIILCFFLLVSLGFFLGIINHKPIIKDILPNSPAARHALKTNDVFVEINGHKINFANDVRQEIIASFGKKIDFKVLRDNKPLLLSFAPDMVENPEKEKIPVIGVSFYTDEKNTTILRYDFIKSIDKAYNDTFFIARMTASFFKQLFTGQAPIEQINGPIRIGDAAGVALKSGLWSFLFLMAIISMSIGIVNLLPVPMLDGGHLMFYIFEAVGFKANHRLREILFKAGFVLVMMVMIFTVVNDIIIIGER